MHHLGIGVAARAKLNDPSAIFLAIFLRPFLDKIVTKIGRGIAAGVLVALAYIGTSREG